MDFVKTAELVAECVAKRTQDALKRIAELQKDIDEGFKEEKAKIWKRSSSASKLVEIGMMTVEHFNSYVENGYSWSWEREYSTIKIDDAATVLPMLHKAFGQCKVTDRYEELSADDRTIKVKLDLGKKYFGPSMYLERKLPDDAPCQYEQDVQISKRLVCKRPKTDKSKEDY
jgi:hypothetical protein